MVIVISGIGSEIGNYIARRFLKLGHTVFGTYRSNVSDDFLHALEKNGGNALLCDFTDVDSINEAVSYFNNKVRWDVFISAVGIISPIESFEKVSFDQWGQNITVNALSQLRLLRGILNNRNENASVFFMTSKGINDTFSDHSAYCISKIMLIKMCELLDDEIDDCKFIAFNPGYIKTKIINQEIEFNDKLGGVEDEEKEEKLENVFRFLAWTMETDKKTVSGRNYFVKYDKWEKEGFSTFLQENDDTYKLRRYRDDWLLSRDDHLY